MIIQIRAIVIDEDGLKKQLTLSYENITDFSSLSVSDFQRSHEETMLIRHRLFFHSEIRDSHFVAVRKTLEKIYRIGKYSVGNHTYFLSTGPIYINNNNDEVMIGCPCPATNCFEENGQKICRENQDPSSIATQSFIVTSEHSTLRGTSENGDDTTIDSYFDSIQVTMEFDRIANTDNIKDLLSDFLNKVYEGSLDGFAGIKDLRISSNIVVHRVEFSIQITGDVLRKIAIKLYNVYKNARIIPGLRFKSIPRIQHADVNEFVFCMCLGQQCVNNTDSSFSCRDKIDPRNSSAEITTIVLAVVLPLLAVALIVALSIFLYKRYKYDHLVEENSDVLGVASAFGSVSTSYSNSRLPLKFKNNWQDLTLGGSMGWNSQFVNEDGDFVFCPPNDAEPRNLIHRSSDVSQKKHNGMFSWDYEYPAMEP